MESLNSDSKMKHLDWLRDTSNQLNEVIGLLEVAASIPRNEICKLTIFLFPVHLFERYCHSIVFKKLDFFWDFA